MKHSRKRLPWGVSKHAGHILCWDQDRFGRFDPIEGGHWIFPFRQAGVRLETIAQGKIDWEDLVGQLVYSINQVGKAQYLRDLSRNVVRGQLTAAKAGRAGTGGSAPYGYRSSGSEVSIVDSEAEIVRWIFREYLKPGTSIRAIAVVLNTRKVPTPRGSTSWKQSTVRGILSRRKYTGTFIYGAESSGKYFAGRGGEMIPRRKSDPIAPSQPVVIPGSFASIVDQETFDEAQRKLASRRQSKSRKDARSYALGGVLRCGDCGGKLGGQIRGRAREPHYMCRTYLQAGCAACWHNSIKEAPLLAVIASKIREEYFSPEARDRIRKAIEDELRQSAGKTADAVRLRREIARLDAKIERAAERVLAAPETIVPTLYRKLEELKTERDRLKTELGALSQRKTRSRQDEAREIEGAMRSLDEVEETFAKAEPTELRELLQAFVSEIVLHFEHGRRGKYRTSRFSHGEILLRPCSHMNTTSP